MAALVYQLLRPRFLGSFLMCHFFFFHIPYLVGCEIHWNTSWVWPLLIPSIWASVRSRGAALFYSAVSSEICSPHARWVILQNISHIVSFFSSKSSLAFPTHSDFLSESLSGPYWPYMFWPRVSQILPPLTAPPHHHSALETWPSCFR